MNFFKPVYDFVVKGFNKLLDIAGVDFYAFAFLAVFVLGALVGIISVLNSRAAKTAKKLVKVNNLLVKNQRAKAENFNEQFDHLMKKGKDRVKSCYISYLSNQSASISDVFNDARIQRGYSRKTNFVKGLAYICSFLLFVITIGIYAKGAEGLLVLASVYTALIFPVIIVVLNIFYSVFYSAYKKRTENIIIDYSAAIAEHIGGFFGETKQARKTSAANEEKIDPSSLPALSEEDYAAEIARLVSERERLEQQVEKEKEQISSSQQKIESDIVRTREELVEVREQISSTDNADKQEALKQQENSQVKLISVLEKLKQTQQKHYDEAENKLQKELSKIEELIEARKKRQQQNAANELNAFATAVKADVTAAAPATQTQAAEAVQQPAPPAEKKDMNEALSNLLNTMNKIEKQDN